MKTNHSSLLADTGLSEIELDRVGLNPVERDWDKVEAPLCSPIRKGWHNPDSQTLAPFRNQPWYEDEDVRRWLPRDKEWWGSK